MINIDKEKVVKKWIPVIESIRQDILEYEQQKLNSDEKLCLYSEYHSMNEASYQSSTIDVSFDIPNSFTNEKSTLPISIKLLTWISLYLNMENIYIIPSPIYEIPRSKKIQVGDYSFTKPINKNVSNLDKMIDDIIYDEMIEFFKSKSDKKIYIYLLIQSIKIIENVTDGGSSLVWSSRFLIE